MVLLRLLRFILFCGQDDEEQQFNDYRSHHNYTPINPPAATQYRRNQDDDRSLLSPARSNMESSGNLKPTAVVSSVNRLSSNPSPASKPSPAIVSSTNINNSAIKLSVGPEKTPFSSSVVRVSSNPSNPVSKPSPAPVSSTNINNSAIKLSVGPEKTPFSSSEVIRVSSNPSNSVSKPSPAPVSSTNINTSAIKLSVGPEKLQITKDSVTPLPLKFHAPSISSSTVLAQSSKKPSLSAVSIPISQEKLQNLSNSATRGPERSLQETLLLKLPSRSVSSLKTDSSTPTLQSKVSLPTNLSSAPPSKPSPAPPISTVNSSFSGDGGRVWRKKEQSQQNIYSAFLSSIKVSSPDSSSSGSSSPSATPESRRSSKRVLSRYEIPKNLEEMIKKDIVPPILKCPLSPLTYADYFATLLYAEDFYLEKWSEFLLKDVVLELRPRDNHNRAITVKRKDDTPNRKDFIAFKLDDIPEERPFLLSRDFVFLQLRNSSIEPFKGILFRVVRNVVLVEFGNDFHWQHSPAKRYDVSFSFNRVCLKRAHQAISISADPSFHSILFPDRSPSPQLHDRMPSFQDPARRIANHRGPIPFLLQGQLVTEKSPTGRVLQLAMLNIYRANPGCRILICSATNNTSDVLLRSLRERLPEASFFRVNAAFRNYDLVPDDIVPASLYEEEQECFSCPPLSELITFNIVTCTFMSSLRLSSAGIDSDHFSHIFLVDACLAIEPEAIVPLANLACRDTAVVVTGCLGKSPEWVRSEIARRNGLTKSYFSRLLLREPYRSGDSMFTLQVGDSQLC